MQFVTSILEAVAPLGVSSVLVCEQGARDTDEFTTHLGRTRGAFEIDEGVPTTRGKAAHAAGILRFLALRKAITRHGADHVYIPYADGLIQVAGLARKLGFSLSRPGMEIEALMMRGRFAYDPPTTSLRSRIAAIALGYAPINILHHLDPIVYDYLRRHSAELAGRLRLLPEPVETIKPLDVRAARVKLGIAATGNYLGCLGALSAGKGVALLLKAFASAPPAADARLLLIGKPDAELRRLLDNEYHGLCEAGRILHIDRYVSQEEFHLGLMASDVVCVPYHRQIGSSGIVVRAAAAARPLLGSDFGWVGRVIRDFELGIVCDVTNTPRFTASITGALASASGYRQGPKALMFSNFHRLENFQWHWTRRLRERLGLAMPRTLSAWEWPEPEPAPEPAPIHENR